MMSVERSKLEQENTMSRRHFVALAEALNGERPIPSDFSDEGSYLTRLAVWRRCVNAVADTCARFSDTFDRGRFIRAAGVR